MKLIAVYTGIFLLMVVSWGSSAQQFDIPEDARACPGGYCVKKYLCVDNAIVIHGDSLIDERALDYGDVDDCEHYLMVCCPFNNTSGALPTPRAPAATKPPKTDDSDEDMFVPPPSYLTCGQGNPNGKIYNLKAPSVAQFAEFPWMAALMNKTQLLGEERLVYFCGGSLIHPQVILTAAHCLRNYNQPENLVVRLGEWDTLTENEPHPHQHYDVRDIIIHESFISSKYHNDVALLILSKSVDQNIHISKICLPEPNDVFEDGMACVASGWGKKDFGQEGKYANVLKKVDLPLVENGDCRQLLRKTRLGPYFQLHSSFMCAGGQQGVDMCKGDGGAPLSCVRENGQYVQVGITAWGIGCGDDGVPGVYVNVAKFVEWIQRQIELEGLVDF